MATPPSRDQGRDHDDLRELQGGYSPAPTAKASRQLLAALLRGASAMLSRLALNLTSEPTGVRSDPRLEFHAEAGAPEGALCLDGRLIGWSSGVSRL